MSSTSPQPDAGPPPPGGAPEKSRNLWVWITAALALVAIGLLIWALRGQSDLDSAQADLKSSQQQVESTQKELSDTKAQVAATPQPAAATPTATPEGGGGKGQTAARVAAGALVTGLARELGATREEA